LKTIILKIKKRFTSFLDELSNRIFFYLNVSVKEIESRKKNNVICIKYGRDEEVVFKPPVFVKKIPCVIKNQIGVYKFLSPTVCIIENVKLSLPRAVASLKYNICIAEINYYIKTDEFKKLKESNFAQPFRNIKYLIKGIPLSSYYKTGSIFLCSIRELFLIFRLPGDDKISGYLFTMVNRNSKGYYHWIVEDLPRLQGYEYIRKTLGIKPKILIDQDPPQWKKETLSLMGYKEEDLVEWDGRTHLVDKLVFSTPSHKMVHTCSPHGCRWVKDRINDIQKTNNVDTQTKKRIYISRAKARTRKVVNEREVMGLLATYHFEYYILEELSFYEKVTLFQQAELVVGPHGAGFVHLAFCNKRVGVIEFFGKKIEHCFYSLSTGLGFDYSLLVCESEKLSDKKDDELINVNINKLKYLLNNMITTLEHY